MREFDHSRMEVYRRAIALVKSAGAIRGGLPPGRSSLGDQLDRTAVSIALNVAQGAGEFAPREKARFYRMARRSATECAAILDVIAELELGGHDAIEIARGHLRAIVAMLVALARHLEGKLKG